MKYNRIHGVKRVAGKVLRTVGFATGLSVLSSGLLAQNVQAGRVPIVCEHKDGQKLVSDYTKLPMKKRIKRETGETLIRRLKCIHETRGLPPKLDFYYPLLKWTAMDDQNALGTLRLIRDVVKNNPPKSKSPLAYQSLRREVKPLLYMVVQYWKRSQYASKMIDAYLDVGRNPGPLTSKEKIEKAGLVAFYGTNKEVPGAVSTLISSLKDKDKEIREMAASDLFTLSYSAMNWLDTVPESVHPGGLMGKYGFSIMLLGSGKTGKKLDENYEKALAKAVLSACMRRGVVQRIQRNLDGPEAHDMRLIRKAVRKEKLLK